MICVSIAERTPEECIAAARSAKMAEIRIDRLEKPDAGAVRKIFSSRKGLIATCRGGGMGDQGRKELLAHAIDSGASYVDIEVESGDSYKEELRARARKAGCSVIISYHNHEKTPSREELLQVIDWCFASGADIAKIACMVNDKADNARLLGLLDGEKRLVVVGMGQAGRITRVVAPLLGSEFTFASSGKGKETAEGQVDEESLQRILEELAK
ncbi:MAG TPA: type I 3-dehydroquinate dehydratase [Candidatus Bilamarchaeum sp.]|nr:type I 3-dehydroquinate dehydratase [Candidatus Bilamarchaeum sp.]